MNYFENEILLIQSLPLRMFVDFMFKEKVPKYFFEIGASSSGKYHPDFSQGKNGLVFHTKAVCAFCAEMFRLAPYCYLTREEKDYALVACLLHDICKYGKGDYDTSQYPFHADAAADLIAAGWLEFFDEEAPFLLLRAVRAHMGQWTTNKMFLPMTRLDHLVHLSDYWASRSFISMPELVEEKQKLANCGD